MLTIYYSLTTTDRAATPTIHQPYNSADTPAIHNLPLASYCYDNDYTALPYPAYSITADYAVMPIIY